VAEPSPVVATKSTNVRSWYAGRRGLPQALASAGLRALFATVGRIAPGPAGELARRLFFSPPRLRGGTPLPAGADDLRVAVGGAERIAAWRCGEGPAVLLMHGWGGSSAQLARLAPPLLQRGFSVVALDGPAHGRTPGRLASLPQFARALAAVAEAAGPVHAIVGHSMGAAAAALAVAEGLRVERLVMVGSAADPARWARAFAAHFHVPAPAMASMGRRSEERLRFRWSDLHMGRLLEHFPGEVLFVHDRDDRETRWSEAFDLARHLHRARVVLTAGLGHRRILAHPRVAAVVAEFVATGATEHTSGLPLAPLCGTGGCGRPAQHGHALCGSCALDRHLFERGEARWGVA
jgi:pimeloyl-ACP methyl ester carboxylesterase